MPNKIIFKKKIENFNKKISIPGDKSLSIRWVLISSLSKGISTAQNLLMSKDVLAAIQTVKKLGVKVVFNNQTCKIAKLVGDNILSLPLYPTLTKKKLDYICEKVQQFFKK